MQYVPVNPFLGWDSVSSFVTAGFSMSGGRGQGNPNMPSGDSIGQGLGCYYKREHQLEKLFNNLDDCWAIVQFDQFY